MTGILFIGIQSIINTVVRFQLLLMENFLNSFLSESGEKGDKSTVMEISAAFSTRYLIVCQIVL